MKKLAMTLLAFVLSLTCISGILAASAETSEIQVEKHTGAAQYAELNKWTVTKKYFAVSYTMTLTEHPGKAGDNGCCGIVLGGNDSYECVFIPHDTPKGETDPACNGILKIGPWWTTNDGGALSIRKELPLDTASLYGKEVTLIALCSQEDGKLTVDSVYVNGVKQDWAGCTLDNFNGKAGYATKLSDVEATAKFVESDEKLDEKCFDAKPAPTPDPDPKPDPDPGKKPATTPDTPPKTGTASVVIASVAVISLAGVVIATKKRNQDD